MLYKGNSDISDLAAYDALSPAEREQEHGRPILED
jgi:hypothetical protein